jgi:hypothetical protein
MWYFKHFSKDNRPYNSPYIRQLWAGDGESRAKERIYFLVSKNLLVKNHFPKGCS